MTRDDKFTRLAALRPVRKKEALDPLLPDAPDDGDRLARLLGARINRNHFGEHLSLKQWYATPELCAANEHSASLLLPKPSGEPETSAAVADPEKWLFLDTETTGLSGGTGTYAFLVGIAWWDAEGLQVEQLFMRDLDEEHSLLLELAERMEERPVLVTFNGKSFDWPLLETRYRMTRSIHAFAPKAHLDLLHPSRQLWRLRLGTVRLKDLERHVLRDGNHSLDWSRDEDIDSSLIPQMYFDYLRGGSAEPLAGVFRHNQMDLRGLAALAGRIFELLDSGNGIRGIANEETRDAIDVFGLSRLFHRRGHFSRARELYESALRFGLPRPVERLAQRELAQLAKREQDYTRATTLWEDLRQEVILTKRDGLPAFSEESGAAIESAIEAAEQLAIYYEHRAKEPLRAMELVRAAASELRESQRSGFISKDRAARIDARLMRRLARLERRCAGASLFERSHGRRQPTRTSV